MPRIEEKKKDDGLVAAWEAAPMRIRLHACRFMLYAHGLIPESQNEKLKQRIEAFIAKREKEKENASKLETD